jgi:spore coat polysaccharide biosynthesis protein SpsF
VNRVGAVILSRYNSSRLPGKALKLIHGKSTLSYIIERLLTVFSTDEIILATSTESSDDPIAAFAQENGIACFRGSLNNVAERFFFAAKSQNWDYAVRINGDNIFADIPLMTQIKKIAETGEHDFVSNVKNRTFPKGMSVEAVRLSHYAFLLDAINASNYYQEHVTIYLYENEKSTYHFIYNTELPDAAGMQMALDTQEDFERTENILAQFKGSHLNYNMKEILALTNALKHE